MRTMHHTKLIVYDQDRRLQSRSNRLKYARIRQLTIDLDPEVDCVGGRAPAAANVDCGEALHWTRKLRYKVPFSSFCLNQVI